MATNNKIKVVLVSGFFWTLVNGFSLDADEPVLIKPWGLRSYNQAMSMAIGKITISASVINFSRPSDRLRIPVLIAATFQSTSAAST